MLTAAGFKVELPDAFEENARYLGRLWKKHPESWTFIPRKYCVNDYDRLQMWMQDNRKRYMNGELSDGQKALLESINFPLQGRAISWERDLKKLREWVEKHDRYPGRSGRDKDEYSLADWRFCQRRRFRQGRLSAEKYKALNSVRPDLLKGFFLKRTRGI